MSLKEIIQSVFPNLNGIKLEIRNRKTSKHLETKQHTSEDSMSQRGIQISFNGWMCKQAVVHPHHGIQLLRNKEERTIDTCTNLDESSENYVAWKTPVPKGYIHTVWFNSHNILEMIKWEKWRTDEFRVRQGMRAEGKWGGHERAAGGILWWWKCSASRLYNHQHPAGDMVMYYNFAKYCHWEKLG